MRSGCERSHLRYAGQFRVSKSDQKLLGREGHSGIILDSVYSGLFGCWINGTQNRVKVTRVLQMPLATSLRQHRSMCSRRAGNASPGLRAGWNSPRCKLIQSGVDVQGVPQNK